MSIDSNAHLHFTLQFNVRRLGLDKRRGKSVDEMYYSSHACGSKYGYANTDARAYQRDLGRGEGEHVMFIAAVSTEKVHCVMPIPAPATVNGLLFEYYCTHFLIPEMIRENKTYVVMDNAKPHRSNVLRAIFALHNLAVYFLPPYSPWLQPIENIFNIAHMKCNMNVEHTRSSFIQNVIQVMDRISPEECDACWRVTGWT